MTLTLAPMPRFAFISLLALLAADRAAAQCAEIASHPEVRAMTSGLDSAAAVGPVWGEYSLQRHPIVLVSQKADTTSRPCATIWRFRKPAVVVEGSGRVRYSTPLYGMWNVDSVAATPAPKNAGIAGTLRRLPPELESALANIGESRAVFLPVPLDLESLGALGRSLAAMKIDTRTMLLQLAVHESYHLHSQIPTWLGQTNVYPWPSWDVQPDRRAIVQRCYGETPAVKAAHADEIKMLITAWDSLEARRDGPSRARAIALARRYAEMRQARYAMLADVTVPSPDGPMGCRQAEDVMEMEEGAPQWIAYETLTRAGLMDSRTAGRVSNEAFYVSGVFQLWIMQQIVGREPMLELSTEMARSTDHKAAIFGRFMDVVRR